jgi:prevent-host-death family protein
MKLSEAVKPISYIKAHTSEVVREVNETRSPVVITLNGEATAVLQGIREYEQMQDSLSLLKILARSRHSVEAGRTEPMQGILRDIRKSAKAAR